MALRVFDFRCANGHVHEHFVQAGTERLTCPTCGADSVRLLPAVRAHLDAVSGHFPGATMSWEARREQHMRKERKVMKEHGEYLTGGKVGDAFGVGKGSGS